MRIRSLLFLLLPLLASCSIALSNGPPDDWQSMGTPEGAALSSCSPTPTWGFIDVVMSIVSLGSGYVASSGHLDEDERRGEYIVAGGIVAALFGAGASVGFRRADNCQAFHRGVQPDFLSRPRLGERLGSQPSSGPPIRVTTYTDRPNDPSLILGEVLREGNERVLMRALQRIRPQWLRATGTRNTYPAVIMDNQPYDLDMLSSVNVEDVEWIRFVSPSDATILWGTGYPGGAIQLQTRR